MFPRSRLGTFIAYCVRHIRTLIQVSGVSEKAPIIIIEMSRPPPLWSPNEPPRRAQLSSRFRLFALGDTADLGRTIAAHLKRPLNAHEERSFEDGEHKSRPLDSVEGADVYVIQSTHGGPEESANDKLCRLLFFIGALRDAGADSVTAVVPYLCYARKDRRTKPNDPVTTRYTAELFDALGADAVVTLEVHNPAAFENAFRCRTVTLTATPLYVAYLRARETAARLVVLSPDTGGAKRAELLRETLESAIGCSIGKAFVDKHRSGGIVTGDALVGDVSGATAIVVDDLISTGNTLARAAHAARRAGAHRVIACAAHGLFITGSADALGDDAIDRIVVTDSVPPFRLPPGPARDKIETMSAAPLLSETIRRLHEGLSLTDLLVF